MPPKIYYFHDPMCSWCWAFQPAWQETVAGLPKNMAHQRILGGLAPDNDQVMPKEMQAKLQATWQKIQQAVPGTRFNFGFWENCIPRRSTYAACRAVIAARRQGPGHEEAMVMAIQKAYYLEARNPADISTLIELAGEINLDTVLFSAELQGPAVHEALSQELGFTHKQGIKSFPTLLFENQGVFTTVQHAYHGAEGMLDTINSLNQLAGADNSQPKPT